MTEDPVSKKQVPETEPTPTAPEPTPPPVDHAVVAGRLLGALINELTLLGMRPLEKKPCPPGAWPSRVIAIGSRLAEGLARGKAKVWEAALETLYPGVALIPPPPPGAKRDRNLPAPDAPNSPEKRPAAPVAQEAQ